jgi:hypothetical protein
VRLRKFESEFDANMLPVVDGKPLGNADLLSGLQAMPLGARVDLAREALIIQAVRSYYFAKAFREEVRALEGSAVDPLWTVLGIDLMKLAVINIAAVNDGLERTKSLPNTIAAISAILAGAQKPDARAAAELLGDIKRATNADTTLSLMYVRHMRNKWAGHASFDRYVDGWADAETSLSLPLVEDALARLVNAYQDVSEISAMSEDVRQAIQPDEQEVDADATSIPMSFDWSASVAMAGMVRDVAKHAALRTVRQLAAPKS